MITSKATRCQLWVWAYISKHPGLTTRDIQGSTSSYGAEEIARALEALVAFGYIERDCQHLWKPVITFTMVGV